jgi:Asp-tRNA(Asn)/Glu-tRNA(Gln) amidotransferase B subunit
MDQQRLAQIEDILSNDPDAVEKLKSGEMSMTEFAIRVYRDDPNNPAAIA